MPPAIPRATYRLQLTADFGFDAAAAVAPYLKALGITHVYASPFMKARRARPTATTSSTTRSSIRSSAAKPAFERLSEALQRHDLGLILDFVPNHVGVHFADNPWWLDVLEWGPASPHAASFDIDWDILPYRAARRRAAADHRHVLRPGAGARRDRTALRRRRRQLFGLVFRAPTADRARALQRDAARRSSSTPTPRTARPAAPFST